MSVDLVLLANGASCNEMFNKSGKTQPPEVAFKDRLGVEDSHVAQKGGGVDQMEEGRAGRWGNIHAFAKVKMSIVK